jgi:hypothetical protein
VDGVVCAGEVCGEGCVPEGGGDSGERVMLVDVVLCDVMEEWELMGEGVL